MLRMEKRSMLASMLNAGLNGLGAALCRSMKPPMSVLGCQSAFKFWTPIPGSGGQYCRPNDSSDLRCGGLYQFSCNVRLGD